jgi:4-amino-4-deoxy-L-arabinose transferase-like glycosyltransferase
MIDIKKELKLPIIIFLPLLGIILFSIFVRLQGLGYSNFQGDEINTVTFIYGMKDGLLEYLFGQKRGPIQYVINFINYSIFGYLNESQIRLPYFAFGVLALFSLYKLSKRIFGNPTAFYTTLFMAVNGLFIAFSRITQYQAFMYMLIPFGILNFIKAIEKNSTKLFALSGVIITIALLAHYDTLSVMPFFISAFVGVIFRKNKEGKLKVRLTDELFRKYLKNALVFFILAIVPAISYYIPFYFHSAFESSTSGYLSNRLFGGGLMPKTGLTLKLISMYSPKYSWYFLFLAGFIGLAFLTGKINDVRVSLSKYKIKLSNYYYLMIVFLLAASSALSLFPVKPRTSSILIIFACLLISFILTFSRKVDWKKASISVWFSGNLYVLLFYYE